MEDCIRAYSHRLEGKGDCMAGIQIMGLASGIDVNAAIDKLLALERIPITRMAERKSIYKQQQDAWRDINTRLSALDTRLTDLRLPSTFHGRVATSADDKIITATAGNLAMEGIYEIEIETKALAQRIASTKAVADYTTEEAVVLTVTVGAGDPTEIAIAAGLDLSAIVKTINEAKAGVNATIIGGSLVLESAETGTNNLIQLEDGDSGFLNALNLYASEGEPQLNTIQHAQDAELTINGIRVTSHSNNVKDAVHGVTFTLKDTGTTQVTVSPDIDSAVSKIKAFVDQYNSVMNFVGEKVKVTMTDAGDIGSVGTLQGDGTAYRLREALRFQTTSAVSGESIDPKINQLAVLGITTNREGILQIDESKLKKALGESPEEVAAFFNEKATNLKDFIKGYVAYGTGILAEKQESISKIMKDIDRQIERLEDRVARKEESLVRQFTALEKALSGFQSQSDWLSLQINQLSSWAPYNNRRK